MKESKYKIYTEVDFNVNMDRSVAKIKDSIDDVKKKVKELTEERKKAEEEYAKVFEQFGKKDQRTKVAKQRLNSLKQEQEMTKTALRAMEQVIAEGFHKLNEFEAALLKTDEMGTRTLISVSATARKALRSINDTSEEGQKKMKALANGLALMEAEVQTRLMGIVNPQQLIEKDVIDSTTVVSELQSIIKVYEQYGTVLAHNKEELNNMGENSTNAKIQLAKVTGELVELNQLMSRDQIEHNIKFWESITKYAGATQQQVAEAKKEVTNLRAVLAQQDIQTLNSTRLKSNQEVQTSIKGLQDYLRVAENLTAVEREQITVEIEKGKLYLKEQEEMGKVIAMQTQLGQGFDNITKLSDDALAAQAKFWDAELSKESLAQQEALKYRNALQAIRDEQRGRITNKGVQSLNKDVAGTNLTGLKEMRQHLEDFKQTLGSTSPFLEPIRKKMQEITEEEEKIEGKAVDVKKVLSNIKTASMDDLQKASAKLKQELQGCERGTEEYIAKSRQLQVVEDRIRGVNQEWGQTGATIDRVVNQFGQQLISFFGITKLIGFIQQSFGKVVSLSDEMTNVAKVTNLLDEDIKQLTNDIMALDTRTAREELMKLAEQGGKLGIATERGVQGLVDFVSEGQKMLTTLGEEAGGAEVVTQILKINDLVNKGGESVNSALNKIGSSILNVGNNSKASYKDITEFVTRLGSTGSVAHLTMEQIIALGGTFSALGSSMETSSTMMIRLLMGLQTKTEAVARAAGANVAEVMALMDQNQTFEALNMILDATSNNAQRIQDVLKAVGGKIGAQMTKELSVLSSNLGTLNYQLDLAADGYSRARLLTQEFDRANDNLAGNLQRLSHYWEEMFVNPKTEGALSDIVKTFYQLNKVLVETKGLLPGILSAMGLLAGMMMSVSTKTTLLGRSLARTWEHLVIIRKHFLAAIPAMLGFRNASEASRRSLEAMKAAGFSNWLTLIITLLGALVGWMIQLARATTSAAKATAELETQLQQELATADQLFNALKKENLEKEEKARLISLINTKYGKYLDNMLSETSSANELALAHKRVAAALREEMMAKGQQAIMEKVAGDSYEKMGEGLDRMQKSVADYFKRFGVYDPNKKGNKGYLTIKQEDAINQLMDAIEDSAKSLFENAKEGQTISVGDIEKKVKNYFLSRSKKTGDEAFQMAGMAASLFQNVNTGTNRYIEGIIQQYEAVGTAQVFMGRQQKQADKSKQAVLDALAEDINDKIKESDLSDDEIELLIKRINEYSDKTKDDKSPAIQARRSLWNSQIPRLQIKLEAHRMEQGWIGKSDEDIENLDVNYLNALKKRYNEVIKASNPYERMNKLFPGLGIPDNIANDPKALRNDMQSRIDRIVEEFKRRGLNSAGNYISGAGGGGGGRTTVNKDQWKVDTREAISAGVASVDNYFEVMETEIRRKGNELGLSEEEVERQLFVNEQEHLQARVKLRRSLLGLHEGLTEEEMQLYGVEEKAVKMISTNLQKMDKERESATLAMNKDLNEVEKNLAERMKKIKMLLLDDEPIEKAMEEFRSSMASLSMIIGDMEQVDDELNKTLSTERFAQLVEWGRNAYSLTVEQLKEAMMDESHVYHDWLMSLGDSQDEVLLAMLKKLQNYHDEVLKAQKPILDHIERYVNIKWKATGREEAYNTGTAFLEEQQGTASKFDQYVGGSGLMTKDAELNLINLKIDAKREYINMLREEVQATIALRQAELEKLKVEQQEVFLKEKDPTKIDQQLREYDAKIRLAQQLVEQTEEAGRVAMTNAYKDMNALQDEWLNNSIETMHRFDSYYKNAADEFAASAQKFGEGIFGSKEDRQEAAKDVVRTVLTTTKQILQAYLTDLATYNLVEQQKAAVAEVYAAKRRLLDVQELKDKAAVESAEIALYQATATAKAASQHLWVGLAIGAAISAALSLLLGAAMGKVNQATAALGGSESQNAGKFTSRMLTYASGNVDEIEDGRRHRVIAKDGRTYNAKYEEKLQTGIYGGGAHFGIFSEEQPEAIIDGKTTRKLVVDYPAIWDAIVTISKTGSIGKRNAAYGMEAYAEGNVAAIPSGEPTGTGGTMGAGLDAATIAQLVAVLSRLNAQLAAGIGVNMWGDKGLWKSMQDAQYFAKKNGL